MIIITGISLYFDFTQFFNNVNSCFLLYWRCFSFYYSNSLWTNSICDDQIGSSLFRLPPSWACQCLWIHIEKCVRRRSSWLTRQSKHYLTFWLACILARAIAQSLRSDCSEGKPTSFWSHFYIDSQSGRLKVHRQPRYFHWHVVPW